MEKKTLSLDLVSWNGAWRSSSQEVTNAKGIWVLGRNYRLRWNTWQHYQLDWFQTHSYSGMSHWDLIHFFPYSPYFHARARNHVEHVQIRLFKLRSRGATYVKLERRRAILSRIQRCCKTFHKLYTKLKPQTTPSSILLELLYIPRIVLDYGIGSPRRVIVSHP